MKQLTTTGIICLCDDFNFTYKIAKIEFIEYENKEFLYRIEPYYQIIDMLKSSLFQGIPGIDLNHKNAVYERKNIVPVFISERAPSANREDLWQLLEQCNMKTLNQLEWLIKTKTRYSGDRFFVISFKEKKIIETNSMYDLVKRSDFLNHKLLEIICNGDDLITNEITINDKTRKYYYDLLMPIYMHDYENKRKLQRIGIEHAKDLHLYKGRQKKEIDPLYFEKISNLYSNNEITAAEAANRLNISLSTFFRRIKKSL